MGYAYGNDGMSHRMWDDPNNLMAGEVYFITVPNEFALTQAFPNHTAAVNIAAGKVGLRNAVNAGCQIVSTGTPSLSGTYGISPQDEINIMALQVGVSVGAPWLGGYRDISGVKHTMTSDQFTAVATAILGYVETIDEAYALSQQGNAWSPPAQPVTIA